MRAVYIMVLCMIGASLHAQSPDTLLLKHCHEEAVRLYPMTRQRSLLDQVTAVKISSLQTTYLPQLFLNGQASWQSDVTEIPFDVPFIQIPAVDKDMYKMTLDLQQLIWDGGSNRHQKELEKLGLQIGRQGLEAELYGLKERINQLYFSILLFQQNSRILLSVLDRLKEQQAGMEAGVRHGLILAGQRDVLLAEIMKTNQQLLESEAGIQAGLNMLGVFLDRNIPSDIVLKLPDMPDIQPEAVSHRLEQAVMELKQQQLELTKNLIVSKYLPKISAFAQAGYGKPGLNMLKSEFDDFYMVGARLQWNIWNWNQQKRDKQGIDLQKDIIATQRETFDRNLTMNLRNLASLILKNERLLEKDDEIIRLRSNITRMAATQLGNGVITSSDYIAELNQESIARLNKESHAIQLVRAKIEYLTVLGNY